MKTITKPVLAEIIKNRGAFDTKAHAERAVEDILEVIAQELAEGSVIKFMGFGTFATKDVPERQGKNPQTGEAVTIKAHKKVSFKPGKLLKERIQG